MYFFMLFLLKVVSEGFPDLLYSDDPNSSMLQGEYKKTLKQAGDGFRQLYLCGMAWKETKMYSILAMKCPKCHKGDLFLVKNAYRLKDIASMHEKCSVCQEDFLREPGFYFGAAYVSYGLTVALWVAAVVALKVFDFIGLIEYGFLSHPATLLITGITLLVLLLPLLYRLSRSIWINMFVHYKKPKSS